MGSPVFYDKLPGPTADNSGHNTSGQLPPPPLPTLAEIKCWDGMWHLLLSKREIEAVSTTLPHLCLPIVAPV